MLYLGARLILSRLAGRKDRRFVAAPISDWSAIRRGTVNNLTNPKSLLFMFAFLPQLVDPGAGPVWIDLLLLGCIQKLAGVLSLGSVALASGAFGHWLYRWPKLLAWQQRFTGMVMGNSASASFLR